MRGREHSEMRGQSNVSHGYWIALGIADALGAAFLSFLISVCRFANVQGVILCVDNLMLLDSSSLV